VFYSSGTWSSDDPFNVNIDGLSLGSYNFTIILNDTSNNLVIDTVIITVIDTIDPSITNPSDTSYSEDSPNNNITWTGTETNPDNYVVTSNGTEIDTGTWMDGVPIVADIDGLVKGIHIIIITIYDTTGNNITDQVIVTVNDTTDPLITSPSDSSYSVGSTGNQISWTGTDKYPSNYTVELDGSFYTDGSWTSGIPIEISIDSLAIGEYQFTITINDTTGNFDNDTVIITVDDIVGPGLTHPPDVFYDNDSNATFVISWTATDTLPDKYLITKDGAEVDSGSWITNDPITIDVSGLAIGNYTYFISVNDTTNNISTDTVFVVVRQIDITSPSDFSYSFGSTGNNITWIATDGDPSSYEIYLDGVLNASGGWLSGVPIIINIDGLSIGTYEYNITISDGSSNFLWDVVEVTVVDGTEPVIDSPADIEYELGSSGNYIQWNAADPHPDSYEIWNSTNLLNSGSWISEIPINYTIDGLGIGIYNFTIIISDSWGNSDVDTVYVNVVDTTSPDISPSPTIYFVVSPLNNWISWNITDLNPANFTVYKDGAFFASGDWNNSDNVMINVDGLTEGAYNFEIYAQDVQGNINSNLIIVVVDETAPYFLLERPACETPEGENCEGITWWRTNTELYKNHYIVYVNGTPDNPVTWDNELISYDVSNLMRGYYNITIVIFDESVNSGSSTAWVTIYDGSPPDFSDPPPTKIPVIEGTFGNIIDWENDDEYPEIYEIFRDNQLIFTDTWIANNTN
ncbi:MAG: hypothetical protein ACW99Q_26205, partial [Candidatus Kariarchaeaceae archaeon]